MRIYDGVSIALYLHFDCLKAEAKENIIIIEHGIDLPKPGFCMYGSRPPEAHLEL